MAPAGKKGGRRAPPIPEIHPKIGIEPIYRTITKGKPRTALFAGILATSLIQSSSATIAIAIWSVATNLDRMASYAKNIALTVTGPYAEAK